MEILWSYIYYLKLLLSLMDVPKEKLKAAVLKDDVGL